MSKIKKCKNCKGSGIIKKPTRFGWIGEFGCPTCHGTGVEPKETKKSKKMIIARGSPGGSGRVDQGGGGSKPNGGGGWEIPVITDQIIFEETKKMPCKHKWQIVLEPIFTQLGESGSRTLAVCTKCLEKRNI